LEPRSWHAHYEDVAQLSDDLRFLRRFFAAPLAVASPVPSGRRLAEAVAAQVKRGTAPVLELGPGTGAVTSAILARGTPPQQLLAIEQDSDFAEFLGQRFPTCRILKGDAFRFDEVLRLNDFRGFFGAIVCGVPVLSQPVSIREKLLREAVAWLKPGSPFIQFSYGARPPIPPIHSMEARRAAIVWQNIPPMYVWVYQPKSPFL